MARRSYNFREDAKRFTSARNIVVELRRALEGCEEILDVGCGKSSPLRFVECRHLVGMDAFQPDLDRARAGGTHDEFVFGDGREAGRLFGAGQFDACVALDFIEHLTREDGLKLLKSLERIARRRVVVFTPNGFLPQKPVVSGDFQEHLSGWTVGDMEALGYRVIGLAGLKWLRGEGHRLRLRPHAPWALVSSFTQHAWCRNHPRLAAAILCVKDVGAGEGNTGR
ncbi:MAG: class I SAM-dependent methyltransferase [Lentisphaerae bacterium]|nr:class I SAM-dependent methyltransferase [Lentisphaerota bacterium]